MVVVVAWWDASVVPVVFEGDGFWLQEDKHTALTITTDIAAKLSTCTHIGLDMAMFLSQSVKNPACFNVWQKDSASSRARDSSIP